MTNGCTLLSELNLLTPNWVMIPVSAIRRRGMRGLKKILLTSMEAIAPILVEVFIVGWVFAQTDRVNAPVSTI